MCLIFFFLDEYRVLFLIISIKLDFNEKILFSIVKVEGRFEYIGF